MLVLGGSAIGIASAQTAPTATPATTAQAGQAGYQAFVDALAKRLGINSATLQTAIARPAPTPDYRPPADSARAVVDLAVPVVPAAHRVARVASAATWTPRPPPSEFP